MTGFSDRYAGEALNALVAEYPYIALFIAAGSDSGLGFTEVSGGSYARFATGSGDWASPSGSAPVLISNNFDFHFPTATVAWGNVVAFGLYDMPTNGNLGFWDYLGSFLWLEATVSNASPAIITTGESHSYSPGDTVVFTNEYGGTSPSFSQSNFTGPMSVAHAASNSLDVTNAGLQVNTSTSGSGKIRKVTTYSVAIGVAPFIAAGAMVIRAT
jgi:hypothetical protein